MWISNYRYQSYQCRTSQSLQGSHMGAWRWAVWLKLGDLFVNRSVFKMMVDDYRGLQYVTSKSECHNLLQGFDAYIILYIYIYVYIYIYTSYFRGSTIIYNGITLGMITQSNCGSPEVESCGALRRHHSLNRQLKRSWPHLKPWDPQSSANSATHQRSATVANVFLSLATLMAWRHCRRA